MTAFILDNSILVRERLVKVLSENQNISRIIECTNLSECLIKLEFTIPQIILMEIHLPDGSGLELLSQIKKKHYNITTIVITSLSQQRYKYICKSLGASFFIDKSHGIQEIKKILHENFN